LSIARIFSISPADDASTASGGLPAHPASTSANTAVLKMKQPLRVGAPDFGAVPLRCKLEHFIEQLYLPVELLHIVAQASPYHAVGAEGVESAAHQRRCVPIRIFLFGRVFDARILHINPRERGEPQDACELGRSALPRPSPV